MSFPHSSKMYSECSEFGRYDDFEGVAPLGSAEDDIVKAMRANTQNTIWAKRMGDLEDIGILSTQDANWNMAPLPENHYFGDKFGQHMEGLSDLLPSICERAFMIHFDNEIRWLRYQLNKREWPDDRRIIRCSYFEDGLSWCYADDAPDDDDRPDENILRILLANLPNSKYDWHIAKCLTHGKHASWALSMLFSDNSTREDIISSSFKLLREASLFRLHYTEAKFDMDHGSIAKTGMKIKQSIRLGNSIRKKDFDETAAIIIEKMETLISSSPDKGVSWAATQTFRQHGLGSSGAANRQIWYRRKKDRK